MALAAGFIPGRNFVSHATDVVEEGGYPLGSPREAREELGSLS